MEVSGAVVRAKERRPLAADRTRVLELTSARPSDSRTTGERDLKIPTCLAEPSAFDRRCGR